MQYQKSSIRTMINWDNKFYICVLFCFSNIVCCINKLEFIWKLFKIQLVILVLAYDNHYEFLFSFRKLLLVLKVTELNYLSILFFNQLGKITLMIEKYQHLL